MAIAVFAAALMAGPREAHAAVSPQDRALAQSLFEEAWVLMDANNHADACPKLAESQRLDPGGGTLLNLGLCYEAVGKTASAWAAFEEAIIYARKDGRTSREDFAAKRIASLKPVLSYLTVQVSPQAKVDGLEISLDGNPLRAVVWGTRIPLDPGEHQLTISAPWRESQTIVVRIGERSDNQLADVPELQLNQRPAAISDGPPAQDRGPEEPATDGNRSHAGRVGVFLRGDIDGKGRGAVVVPGVSYGLGDYVEAQAGALLGANQGAWVGGHVYILSGELKPALLLGMPLFLSDGASPGVQGGGGVQWDPSESVGVYAMASVTHFFSPPDGNEQTVFVPVLGVQTRL